MARLWAAGSGTALIACEQTRRKAFLMAIDPLYCDVIVQRWEQFTGKRSELITTDVAHAAPATAGIEGHRA